MIARELFHHPRYGSVGTPDKPMNHPRDGGHLLVLPPREVWERTALEPQELAHWGFLVAATGAAMLAQLPQLEGGCLNYWEAGNFALNDAAPPAGPKDPRLHRKVHMHIFGRSPRAQHPDWRWGAAPRFPAYADSARWSAQFGTYDTETCGALREALHEVLRTRYGADLS